MSKVRLEGPSARLLRIISSQILLDYCDKYSKANICRSYPCREEGRIKEKLPPPLGKVPGAKLTVISIAGRGALGGGGCHGVQ